MLHEIPPKNRVRLRGKQAFTWLLALLFGLAVYLVYRWAEPTAASIAAVMNPATGNNINLELEESTFDNFVEGYKNWSLHAGRIVIERPNAAGITNSLQTAYVENIRDGKFFAAPSTGTDKRVASTVTLNQSAADSLAGKPIATFSAQHGQYGVSNTEGIPPDMLLTYTVLWQFQLTGDVKIRTRDGYRLSAPAITMVELFDRRQGKKERLMLCSQGVLVEGNGVRIQANMARYADEGQSIECQKGVRCAFKPAALPRSGKNEQKNERLLSEYAGRGDTVRETEEDTVQAETLQWTLKENVISCPQSASGIWDSCPYTIQDMRIDVRTRNFTGRTFKMQIRETSKLAAGSLALVMSTAAVAPGQQTKPDTQKTQKPTLEQTVKYDEFSGDQPRYDAATNTRTAKNFIYKHGDMIVTGKSATYVKVGRKPGILDAEGDLTMDDPEHHITALKVHVDEKQELATLTGDVVITLKPQKDDKDTDKKPAAAPAGAKVTDTKVDGNPGGKTQPNDKSDSDKGDDTIASTRKQGAVVKCDQVDNFYKKKFTILKGHLNFSQRIARKDKMPLERKGTAEYAEYDSKKELLHLFPPVKGEDNDGGGFSTEKGVFIGTNPDKETLIFEGRASFTFLPKNDEGDDNPNPKPTPVKK